MEDYGGLRGLGLGKDTRTQFNSRLLPVSMSVSDVCRNPSSAQPVLFSRGGPVDIRIHITAGGGTSSADRADVEAIWGNLKSTPKIVGFPYNQDRSNVPLNPNPETFAKAMGGQVGRHPGGFRFLGVK